MAPVLYHEGRFPPPTGSSPGVSGPVEHRRRTGDPLMFMESTQDSLLLTFVLKVSRKVTCCQPVSVKQGEVR